MPHNIDTSLVNFHYGHENYAVQEPLHDHQQAFWISSKDYRPQMDFVDLSADLTQGLNKLGFKMDVLRPNQRLIVPFNSADHQALYRLINQELTPAQIVLAGNDPLAFKAVVRLIELEILPRTEEYQPLGNVEWSTLLVHSHALTEHENIEPTAVPLSERLLALKNAGCNLNHALPHAMNSNNIEMIQLLIELDVDLNPTTIDKKNVLHFILDPSVSFPIKLEQLTKILEKNVVLLFEKDLTGLSPAEIILTQYPQLGAILVNQLQSKAIQNHSASICILGALFNKGILIQHSHEIAFKLFTRSSQLLDNPQTNYFQGLSLINGWGTPVNFYAGKMLIERSAKQGYTRAENLLGQLYAQSPHLSKDITLAKYWFTRAAEKNYATAYFELGALSTLGKSSPHLERKNMMYWNNKAAHLGHIQAQYLLGVSSALEAASLALNSPPEDIQACLASQAAFVWLSRASIAGHYQATEQFAEMHDKGLLVTRNVPFALEKYQLALTQVDLSTPVMQEWAQKINLRIEQLQLEMLAAQPFEF